MRILFWLLVGVGLTVFVVLFERQGLRATDLRQCVSGLFRAHLSKTKSLTRNPLIFPACYPNCH